MDIKELLQIANEKAVRINELSTDISRIDNVVPGIEKEELIINSYDITLYLGESTTEQLRQHIIESLEAVKNSKLAELEQLLGIQQSAPEVPSIPEIPKIPKLAPGSVQPATDKEIKQAINNIFGAEIISVPSDSGMAPEDKSIKDPVEEKLKEKLQDEAKRIESSKSLDKYPAPKRDGRRRYPENMTEDIVRKMYIDEGKSKKEIAEHFGVKESTVNNYLYLRGISRRKEKSKKPDSDEKERP